jgi:hypothetical protein
VPDAIGASGELSLPRRLQILIAFYLLYGGFNIPVAVLLGLLFGLHKGSESYVSITTQYQYPPAMLILGSSALTAGIGLIRQAEWARPLAIHRREWLAATSSRGGNRDRCGRLLASHSKCNTS